MTPMLGTRDIRRTNITDVFRETSGRRRAAQSSVSTHHHDVRTHVIVTIRNTQYAMHKYSFYLSEATARAGTAMQPFASQRKTIFATVSAPYGIVVWLVIIHSALSSRSKV